MTVEKRKYTKKLRAEQEDATRLRITESAVELHGTLGPSRTSMSDVARHAGVRRSTLYRYFRDEAALFAACSSHWREANPRPDIESWRAQEDPGRRLHLALTEMYAFYSGAEQMLLNLFRDEETVPIVKQTFGMFRGYMTGARDALMNGRSETARTRDRVAAAVGHALAFSTWRSLVREQGLGADEAVDLMCRTVAAAGD